MQKKKAKPTKGPHTTVHDLAKLLGLLVSEATLAQKDMAVALKLSPATITRLLHTARTEYKMVITRPVGRGPYQIESWGLLDQHAILAFTAKATRKAK
jgi:hypothetical protein